MIEYKKYPTIDSNRSAVLTIATGPVIIKDGSVLLDKHGIDQFWKFPGGKLRDDNSPRANAVREVKEELSVDVELLGDPMVTTFTRTDSAGVLEYVILIHYRAQIIGGEISPGRDVREWAWHPIDSLPTDLAPNVALVVAALTAPAVWRFTHI